MLYYHKKGFEMVKLPALSELDIDECNDPHMLSVIGSISFEEAMRRLGNDHKAFVAWYQQKPAAFGWVASGKARIGELNHEITLRSDHRYLWNFRTLAEFRGLGIYPHLLQHIFDKESQNGEWFWIMHAPENRASERGILKAGFRFAGNVSVSKGSGAIFQRAREESDDFERVVRNLGFTSSEHEQARCWKCSSPFLAHTKTACCCDEEGVACNGYVFQ